MRVPIATMALCLTGCIASEAFPTVIDNESGHSIVLRYQYVGHDEWSGDWDIPSGDVQSLARDHWGRGYATTWCKESCRYVLRRPVVFFSSAHRSFAIFARRAATPF